MKKTITNIIAYTVLGLSLTVVSCGSDNTKTETKTETAAAEMTDLTIAIDGMTCAKGCALPIEKMLNETDGIENAKVDFESKSASLSYDKAKLSEEKIAALFNDFKSGAYSAAASTPEAIALRAKEAAAKLAADAKTAVKNVSKKTTKVVEDTKKAVRETTQTIQAGTIEAKDAAASKVKQINKATTSKINEVKTDVKTGVESIGRKTTKTIQATETKATNSATKLREDVTKKISGGRR